MEEVKEMAQSKGCRLYSLLEIFNCNEDKIHERIADVSIKYMKPLSFMCLFDNGIITVRVIEVNESDKKELIDFAREITSILCRRIVLLQSNIVNVSSNNLNNSL